VFSQDDLFAQGPPGDSWEVTAARLRVDLLDAIRQGEHGAIPDLDAAIALAQLLHTEFMAFGTGGGERLNDSEVRLALRALRAVTRRLGLPLSVPWQDFTSFKAYWIQHDGYGSWAARREMVGSAFDPLLALLYVRQDEPDLGRVVAVALDALPDSSAIREHLGRLAVSVDADPRLAVAVAKDLVESTAKLVLRESNVPYKKSDDLPALVARAQEALRLHPAGVNDSTDEALALKTILGSLIRLAQGVTELRNKVGVGHGRESVPAWVRPRHARLAAGAASTWCNLMLETLGDPEAPWRRTASAP